MASTVDPTKFYNKSYEELRNKGDDVTKLVREKMTELINNNESLNMAKMSMLLEEMGKNKERKDSSGTDGDQTPVRGFESQALRMMWAEGGDYSPANPAMTDWARDCYNGNLEKIKIHLDRQPNVIKQRWSTLNMSALHHVIAGARTIRPMPSNADKYPKDVRVKVSKDTDHVGCVKYLIKNKAKVEAKDVAGHTPLHACTTVMANALTLKIAEILLEEGKANVDSVNRFGATPIFEPVLAGRKDCIDVLVKHGANLNVTDNDGVKLMSLASSGIFFNKTGEWMSEAMIQQAKSQQSLAKSQGLSHACVICGNREDVKRCSRCYSVWYCSQTCQKSDWLGHKLICKQMYLEFKAIDKKYLTEVDPKTLTNFVSKGASTLIGSADKPPKSHSVVKIQVDGSDFNKMKHNRKLDDEVKDFKKPMLIYNKDRQLCYMLSRDCPEYLEIVKVILTKGLGGMKGYFNAIKEKESLKINYKRIQIPEPW